MDFNSKGRFDSQGASQLLPLISKAVKIQVPRIQHLLSVKQRNVSLSSCAYANQQTQSVLLQSSRKLHQSGSVAS